MVKSDHLCFTCYKSQLALLKEKKPISRDVDLKPLVKGCKCSTGCKCRICGCRRKGGSCLEGCQCTSWRVTDLWMKKMKNLLSLCLLLHLTTAMLNLERHIHVVHPLHIADFHVLFYITSPCVVSQQHKTPWYIHTHCTCTCTYMCTCTVGPKHVLSTEALRPSPSDNTPVWSPEPQHT